MCFFFFFFGWWEVIGLMNHNIFSHLEPIAAQEKSSRKSVNVEKCTRLMISRTTLATKLQYCLQQPTNQEKEIKRKKNITHPPPPGFREVYPPDNKPLLLFYYFPVPHARLFIKLSCSSTPNLVRKNHLYEIRVIDLVPMYIHSLQQLINLLVCKLLSK